MDNSIDNSLPFLTDLPQPFLTDLLPDDETRKKQKRQNWDTRKQFTTQVGDILATGEPHHQRQAKRVNSCSELLKFAWVKSDAEIQLQFKSAFFCRVRNCPICQWRRAQMWIARFIEVLPRIFEVYPTMRYVLLTLTLKNCPMSELRPTVQHMQKSWQRLSQRKAFPALGFVRSLEVTKETDTYDKKTKQLIHKARPDYVHPHFHILLALPPAYFSRGYLSTADWAQLWKEALKIDYTPVCDVRIVKVKVTSKDAKNSTEDLATGVLAGLRAAIVETIKYTVKPADMVEDGKWLLQLVDQLHRVRAVALGGIFKQFLKEVEDEDLNAETEAEADDQQSGGFEIEETELFFGWKKPVKRYQQKRARE
jgi:plasmid rolling circle replication initiator protein Rep